MNGMGSDSVIRRLLNREGKGSGSRASGTPGGFISMVRGVMLGALVVAGLLGGKAWGATVDGTLITNTATATYNSVSGVQYAVSYSVTATVLVGNPVISLRKTASPSIQSAGGTVTFCIWVLNSSAVSSAFNVIVNDRMPGDTWGGFGFIQRAATDAWIPAGINVRYGYKGNGAMDPYRWETAALPAE